MSTQTIFEKIINREIPARIVHEEDDVLAFHDIQPAAPVHVLIIPKRCIPRIAAAENTDEVLIGRMFSVARLVAAELGLEESGYRLVINNGHDGGETIPHLHLHLLGGRALTWPPG